ncbi:hypothetical protein BGX38DRAFT_1209696, partial [Terfezia claveryi]
MIRRWSDKQCGLTAGFFQQQHSAVYWKSHEGGNNASWRASHQGRSHGRVHDRGHLAV